MTTSFAQRVDKRETTVAVVGLGYVGLPLAVEFAQKAAQKAFPDLRTSAVTPGFLTGGDAPGLVVVSHVLNELSAPALAELRALLGRAQAVLWVESGTRETSRKLSAEREHLRESFQVAAPCTHAGSCPVLAPENERHWCHFFAPVPGEIFANPDWVKFGQRAGIDLRSLPYCFLALDRRPVTPAPGLSRVIGRCQHAHLMTTLLQREGEVGYVAPYPSGNVPGIGAYQPDSHGYRARRAGSRSASHTGWSMCQLTGRSAIASPRRSASRPRALVTRHMLACSAVMMSRALMRQAPAASAPR